VRISADRYLWISTLLFSVFQQIRIRYGYWIPISPFWKWLIGVIAALTAGSWILFSPTFSIFPVYYGILMTSTLHWADKQLNYQSVLSKQYALIYLSDASIATHHQVSFDGLDKSKRIDFDRSAMPLLQIGARRMALQVTLHHTDKRTNIHTHIHTLGTHSTNWKSPLTQNTCFTAI